MSAAVQHFPPESPASGHALVIFPGGGYTLLAPHEGEGYARRFAEAGVDCYVVAYPLAPDGFRHPAMIDAAQAALAEIRAQLAPSVRLGVMGSSAGGHLAGHTLVDWERRGPEVRPDFGVLCYPVVTMLPPHGHTGSRGNLLGPAPEPALAAEVSIETRVTSRTPPCFIWHTVEDATVPVEHSFLLASALRQAGVPFELHAYARGRHGLGLDTPYDWASECIRWMRELV